MNLSMEEKGVRVLTVLYKMSDGIGGVSISKASLYNEVARSNVLNMSEQEFESYKSNTMANVKKASLN